MKHPSSREFFAYWDKKRGGAPAPDRSEFEPGAVRELLGDVFVLSYDAAAGYPFRVAGTRVCALLGCDLKDQSFSALFAADARREIEDIIVAVSEDMLAAVAGISAVSQDGSTVHLELLLLPFKGERGVLRDLKLTSYRYVGHQSEKLVPRALRKLAVARSFMVYEGL